MLNSWKTVPAIDSARSVVNWAPVLDAQIQVAGLGIVDKLGENNRVGTGFPFGFVYLPTGSHGATWSIS